MIKVTTFNANGIRAATKKGFWEWFKNENIDFLCIQETKVQFNQIDGNKKYFPLGYYYDFNDSLKKGYSGTAIYAKKKPLKIIKKLGIDLSDYEGRYIQFDYKNFSIASLYLPSGSSGSYRQKCKMHFLEKYKEILKQQIESKRDFIICGDFNIVHKEIDIKNWKSNYNKRSGVLQEEQIWLDCIFNDIGWIDTFRIINKEPLQYTWWSNRGQARMNNVGWRIDYHISSPNFSKLVVYNNNCIYKKNWFSDHAPLTISYNYNI